MSSLQGDVPAHIRSTCRYGESRLPFRGPARALTGDYAVVLGGNESHGRFVPQPYPALLEEGLGMEVANLACANAGPDVWLADPTIRQITRRARIGVLQIVGALNLSNRFYSVHPRRNDRVTAVLPPLRALFPEVEFLEIHFTRHLMQALWQAGPERFAAVAGELRHLWLGRMKALLDLLPRQRLLLWTGEAPPPVAALSPASDPPLVNRAMVEELARHATAYVEHVASPEASCEGWEGLALTPAERAAADVLPGAAAHRETAAALLPVLLRMVRGQ